MKENKINKEEIKKRIAFESERDHEMVTGIFKHHEIKGGTTKFPFRKYDGDEIEEYLFIDGQQYTIPRMVAEHLNNNCTYNQYEHIPGMPGTQSIYGSLSINKTGIPTNVRVKNKVNRFGFYPSSFEANAGTRKKNVVQIEFDK